MVTWITFAALLTSLSLTSQRSLVKAAVQCGQAGSQVSCHASSPINPDSDETCCFNGALQKGDKESGLVLSTQFYDTDPSTGPKDSTTIHGLWPDYCDGTFPQFCSNISGIPEMTGAQIEALIKENNPTLLDYMHEYYKDVNGDDASFWEHEYNKHGTCFTTLRAKCFKSESGVNATTAAVVGYFEEIVNRFKKLPTVSWLADANITPSKDKEYKLADIEDVLTKKHGAKPYVGCTDGSLIDEFWYYYNTKGPLVGGEYLPVDSTTESSCDASVRFVPK